MGAASAATASGYGASSDPRRAIALEIDNLSKRFGGAMALDGVSMDVRSGEVHGLLGSNGSGKSTLIKILSGFHTPEPGGSVLVHGKPLPLPAAGQKVRELGLAFVHQQLGLIPSLTVMENLRLGEFAADSKWRIDWRLEEERARATFARYNLSLNPRAVVAALPAVEQALLAIVRAIEDLRSAGLEKHHGGVLVLDEPTPFLPRAGVEQLFDLVRQLADEGASVVFVSHDVDEVMEITDRATILRDGQKVETVNTADIGHRDLIRLIIGQSLSDFESAHVPNAASGNEVRLTGLQAPGFGPVDLAFGRGEIVGVTGLIGSGSDRLPALLYGAQPADTGVLDLDGDEIRLAGLKPMEAMQKGIAYLPADRLGQAGIGALSVADNLTMPVLDELGGPWRLSLRRMRRRAQEQGTAAEVKPNSPVLPLSALSGGNQQKVVMAKWLQTQPRLILLDEPTQGVDVGARQALWTMLDESADRGATILVSSTDYDQLAQICHRVIIFSRGQMVWELTGSDVSKEAIAEHCFLSIPMA